MTRQIAVSQITTPQWSLQEAVENYARTEGIQGIGIWSDKLSQVGTKKAAQLLQATGLQVSTLVFIGNFTQEANKGIEDGKRAIENAHQLGAKTLLTVTGPRLHISTEAGNCRTRTALEALAPVAQQADVTLALEPLNPMDVTRYSTVVTIQQALTLVKGLPGVGLIFDIWNTWWEPQLSAALESVQGKIACVQLADWKEPSDNPRNRAVPGEGVAPLAKLVKQVEQLGYQGWYEVEIMSDQYQPKEYSDLLRACVQGTRNVLAD